MKLGPLPTHKIIMLKFWRKISLWILNKYRYLRTHHSIIEMEVHWLSQQLNCYIKNTLSVCTAISFTVTVTITWFTILLKNITKIALLICVLITKKDVNFSLPKELKWIIFQFYFIINSLRASFFKPRDEWPNIGLLALNNIHHIISQDLLREYFLQCSKSCK